MTSNIPLVKTGIKGFLDALQEDHRLILQSLLLAVWAVALA